MGQIAAIMFILLFAYNRELIGPMHGANLQMALFCAFLFGIVCGYHVTKKRRN